MGGMIFGRCPLRQGGSRGAPRMYLPRQNNNVGLLV
jgi:hypothetical protein